MNQPITPSCPRVLTIIVSYNFEPWIERCLGSLRQSTYPTDVVVIDNASTDQTVLLIEENYPDIRLVRNERNRGFGQANNIGMRIALEEGYDYIFLLNQDAWIAPDTLDTLVRLSSQSPDYGILSPTHLNGKGDKLDTAFARYIHDDSPISSKKPALIEIPFINAAFWVIPTSVVRQVGGFSPLFFHYGEDVDYINRIKFYGYRVGYTPLTTGCHDRQDRPTPREMQMRLDRVYFLSVISNLQTGLAKGLWYGVAAPLKPALSALCRGRFGEAGYYLRVSGRLLCRYRYIARVKEFCRQGKPVFLESIHSKIEPIWN